MGVFSVFTLGHSIMSKLIWTPAHASAFYDHHIIVCGRSESGAEKYCRIAKLFFGFVNKEGLDLNSDTVKSWMKHLVLQANNRSNATRASRLSALRSVCKFLVERGELDANPCDGVPTPKFSKKSAQKFSPGELTALFTDAGNNNVGNLRDRCILMFFYATGMRREEMSNVTMDRLTLGTRTGHVRIIGKGAKNRVVSFEGPVVPLLKTWLIARHQFAQPNEPSLFISLHSNRNGASGTRLGVHSMHNVIKRVAKRAGLGGDVFLHKLRSTFATDLYEAHIPINEIAMLMGHSSIETTNGYIAISERHLQKARISSAKWSSLGVES